jgi:hypothetical protein
MKMRYAALLSICAGLALAAPGCKKDAPAAPTEASQPEQASDEAEEPAEADEGQDEAAAEQPTRRPTRPAVQSVEEHLVEVSKEITAENYKDELAKLEAQVNQRHEQTLRANAARERSAEAPVANETDKPEPEAE